MNDESGTQGGGARPRKRAATARTKPKQTRARSTAKQAGAPAETGAPDLDELERLRERLNRRYRGRRS